ncbi:hypothetical protein BASA81_002519 [Batrachochytrium salamandrivorans]|nr:hypothetical protein BASA81_002519 [Batrachochytrium salamandrivorans]
MRRNKQNAGMASLAQLQVTKIYNVLKSCKIEGFDSDSAAATLAEFLQSLREASQTFAMFKLASLDACGGVDLFPTGCLERIYQATAPPAPTKPTQDELLLRQQQELRYAHSFEKDQLDEKTVEAKRFLPGLAMPNSAPRFAEDGGDIASPAPPPPAPVPSKRPSAAAPKFKEEESADLWERTKLVAAGQGSHRPTSTSQPRSSLFRRHEDYYQEDSTEVEIVTETPRFLRNNVTNNQQELVNALEAVKVVQAPDGSMQRAAISQSQLQKDRREVKMLQNQQRLNELPKNSLHGWLDPMAADDERKLATEIVAQANNNPSSTFASSTSNDPEWKTQAFKDSVGFGDNYKSKSKASATMKEQRESLPVFKLKDELKQAVLANDVLILIGETGSGKSTQITQYLVEWGIAKRGKAVGCTQPRRVAATSVARRVADEYGCEIGQEVGYTIRFDDQTTDTTLIKYMTDGMLMREYLMDSELSKYSVLVLDESHERTVHTDVLFALLKALVKRRKDNLKLIVTSATLDCEKFSRYFFQCPVFTIPGRTFPVEVLYAKEPEPDYVDAALITVMQIHLSEAPGDILVFLTGQEEIDQACETLFARMKALGKQAPHLSILPVYGALPSEMQSKIFEPAARGTRKCVIATNIAEASLTIDGIIYVVDPGFAKQNVFNPKTGMDSLVVTPISQASARQRAGRAGRTKPGKCFRLYTEPAYHTEMLETSVPELQRTNLGNVVLQLKAMGINDLLGFDFLDPPPQATLVSAMESLYALEALDDDGLLTRLGRKMAEFPLEPVLSKTLLSSVEFRCADEVLTIVAMLSVEGIFYRPKQKQQEADSRKARFFRPEGDHITLLAVYDAWKESKFDANWCFDNFIQQRAIQRAQEIRKQLMGIMERYRFVLSSVGGVNNEAGIDQVRRAFVSGFFTHAAKRDQREGYRTLVEGQNVYIHPGSSLFSKNPETNLPPNFLKRLIRKSFPSDDGRNELNLYRI